MLRERDLKGQDGWSSREENDPRVICSRRRTNEVMERRRQREDEKRRIEEKMGSLREREGSVASRRVQSQITVEGGSTYEKT